MPNDFSNWNTVRYRFDHWTLDGTFIRINGARGVRALKKAVRDSESSAATATRYHLASRAA
ncbi:MAG: hypothetical protein PVSMB7_24690 [Chloroflexota bacterium]